MKFTEMLYRHGREKTALITESGTYTYGDIIDDVQRLKSEKRGLTAIKDETVYGELTRFLASDTAVPVIAPPDAEISGKVPEDADFAVLSSGSTGIPKLLFRTTESWYDFFGEQNRAFGINETTTLFMHGSLCFSGNLNMLLGALYVGAAVIITKKPLTKNRAADIDRYRADAVYLIPDKLNFLSRVYNSALKPVKTVISGSQLMGAKEARRLRDTLGARRVILYYGASEVSYISYLDVLAADKPRGCVGKPFDGVKTVCRDGFLTVMTDCAALGADMPYTLGDIIREEDGYLYFEGRHDDVLNIGGEKLSASALENEIRALDGADDACVFLNIGADARETLCCAWCGDVKSSAELEKSALTHIPKKWYKLNVLPKNANGKTDREKIKQMCGGKKSL